MKKILSVLLSLIMGLNLVTASFAAGTEKAEEADKPLRVCFIGNSLSYTGAIPFFFGEVARSMGKYVEVGEYINPSRYLAENLNDIPDGYFTNYDIVVLQETVGGMIKDDENEAKYKQLFDKISNEGAQAVLYMVPSSAAVGDYIYTFDAENSYVAQNTVYYGEKYNIPVAPVATAMHDIGITTAHKDFKTFRSDRYHPNNNGGLVAAMTMYRTIFNENLTPDALTDIVDSIYSSGKYVYTGPEKEMKKLRDLYDKTAFTEKMADITSIINNSVSYREIYTYKSDLKTAYAKQRDLTNPLIKGEIEEKDCVQLKNGFDISNGEIETQKWNQFKYFTLWSGETGYNQYSLMCDDSSLFIGLRLADYTNNFYLSDSYISEYTTGAGLQDTLQLAICPNAGLVRDEAMKSYAYINLARTGENTWKHISDYGVAQGSAINKDKYDEYVKIVSAKNSSGTLDIQLKIDWRYFGLDKAPEADAGKQIGLGVVYKDGYTVDVNKDTRERRAIGTSSIGLESMMKYKYISYDKLSPLEELKKEISIANTYTNQDDYTKETYNAFISSKATAENTLKNTASNDDMLYSAAYDLKWRRSKLIPVNNYTPQNAIYNAKNFEYPSTSSFNPAEWSYFKKFDNGNAEYSCVWNDDYLYLAFKTNDSSLHKGTIGKGGDGFKINIGIKDKTDELTFEYDNNTNNYICKENSNLKFIKAADKNANPVLLIKYNLPDGVKIGDMLNFDFTYYNSSRKDTLSQHNIQFLGDRKYIDVPDLVLNKDSVSLELEQFITLLPAVSDEYPIENIEWSSSDNSIASVNEQGKVTAKAPGSAVITAKIYDSDVTAQCKITVNPKKTAISALKNQPLAEIYYDKIILSLNNADTNSLTVTPVIPEGASYEIYADINCKEKIADTLNFYEAVQMRAFIKVTNGDISTVYPIIITKPNKNITSGYTDVADHWCREFVEKINDLGIVKGEVIDGQNYINPEDFATREQCAAFLIRMLGIDVENFKNINLPFIDYKTTWAENYIKTAYALGIMTGEDADGGKVIRTTDNVLRCEFFAMLTRTIKLACEINENDYINFSLADKFSDYKDIESIEWFVNDAKYLAHNSIVSGDDENKFLPEAKIKRSEIIKVIALTNDLINSSIEY